MDIVIWPAITTGMGETAPVGLPEKFALEQNYPNPFNPSTTIAFSLVENAMVILKIYNSLGETVRTLAAGNFSAGTHTVNWDTRDDGGETVSAGVYIYTLQSGEQRISRKMLLVK